MDGGPRRDRYTLLLAFWLDAQLKTLNSENCVFYTDPSYDGI